MNLAERLVLDYLLNSLWQVPLLFAAAWLAAWLVRPLGARAGHRVWVGALFAAAVIPGGGGRGVFRGWWGVRAAGSQGGVGVGSVLSTVDPGGWLRVGAGLGEAVMVVYLGVLVYFGGRLLWGVARGRALQREAEPEQMTEEVRAGWERCCRRFGVMDARLASSAGLAGPVTLGGWRRVLLVPPGFLEGATAGDREAALAHEFAHMQRRDYAKNLLYEAVSLPLAFHPVVLLIKRQIAQSREMVCDDMAAEAMGANREYARSLLRLASMISDRAPVRNLHAIGIFDANILERRVMNLTMKRMEAKRTVRLAAVAASVLLGVAACGTAMALHFEVKAGSAATKAGDNQGPSKHAEVTAGELMGQVVSRQMPVYPAKAKADKSIVNGPVVIGMTVDTDGVPTDLHLLKSLRSDYDESALTAVKAWRYKPYLLNGEPVAVDTVVTITYNAPRD